MSQFFTSLLLVAALFTWAPVNAQADENSDLRAQVKTLQERVSILEKYIAAQSSSYPVGKQPQPPYMAPLDEQVALDPAAQIRAMEQHVREMMQDKKMNFNPQEDIKQTPDAYIVSMDIPGMTKDKIKVEIKNGILIVSGERSSEVQAQDPNQVFRQERSFGNFYRSVVLPDDVKADSIDAQYDNGVLTVKIPRAHAGAVNANGQTIMVK